MITQSELKEILHYDPDTGIFTWIKTMGKRGKIGDEAGYKKTNNYIEIRICGNPYYAHRLAWLYITGSFPSETIDHINGIRKDNKICNLREATYSQNNANKKTISKSGYKGVNKSGKKWQARITIDKDTIYLGLFNTKEEAHEAYKQASIKYHGEFANY